MTEINKNLISQKVFVPPMYLNPNSKLFAEIRGKYANELQDAEDGIREWNTLAKSFEDSCNLLKKKNEPSDEERAFLISFDCQLKAAELNLELYKSKKEITGLLIQSLDNATQRTNSKKPLTPSINDISRKITALETEYKKKYTQYEKESDGYKTPEYMGISSLHIYLDKYLVKAEAFSALLKNMKKDITSLLNKINA